jgi:Glycosyl transferase family 11
MKVIVKIQGGLGNQLFQFACGKSLAIKHGATLTLNTSWFATHEQGVTSRAFLLERLCLIRDCQITSDPITKPSRWQRLLQNFWPSRPYWLIEREHFRYDSKVWRAPRFTSQNLFILGYWQSFRYFEKNIGLLREEILPRYDLSQHYQLYAKTIESDDRSVMIHVRRGDYVNLAHVASWHGALGLTYYQKACTVMTEKIGSCHFFIFSDDLIWVKEQFDFLENCTFIENEATTESVIAELMLMRMCRHHIIANSSLSWWAAWLSQHPEQQVICPKQWIQGQHSFDDLLPSQWLRLES